MKPSVIKNIDKNTWLSGEENGKVSHSKDLGKAILFSDENDAETTLEYLNEEKPDCYTLMPIDNITTHTAGKFHFDGVELILSENGEVIADIRSCNHYGEELEDLVFNRDQEEAQANARLLAAAPELLKAAIDTLRWLEINHRAKEPEFFGELKAAIKKATE